VLPIYERDLMFALMLAGLLAVGLTVSMEYLDSRLKTPDDIKSYLGLPFLGLVPSVRSGDAEGNSPLLERGVPPAFAEAMRAVRTGVMFSTEAEGGRTLVITSTAPGEGKTVVAANLADALARAEQRTLLIDGDLRKPRVHEVFEYAQEPGLSNVLAGTSDVQAAIRQTAVPYLAILPAGTIPSNPAELLASQRYRELLADLGKNFDWIILDSPPVMAVTDAAVISNTATGVLFVVGADMTPRRIAQAAIEQLTAARGRIAGAVLNRVNLDKHSYYYAQYYRKDYAGPYINSPQGRAR
jgi:capsular exopolysaccharide synthesis family protein